MYQKVIVSFLATILLAFGIQDIGYSQNVSMKASSADIPINRELIPTVGGLTGPEKIYSQSIHSVIWITTDDSQGSGVLIDEDWKIAVTNKHVTKDHPSVNVFFPVPDAITGDLVFARRLYKNKSNYEAFIQHGYATTGHIIKEDSDNDLAVIRLDRIPKTAREIDCDSVYNYREMVENISVVYVLGNPGEQDLWRWTSGHFQGFKTHQNFSGKLLHISADIYRGNSGGPVLDNNGRMIGIIALSDEHMNAYAIPLEYIDELMRKPMITSNEIPVFSITNYTGFTVPYLIKWTENSEWAKHSLSKNKINIHWYPKPSKAIPADYPQVLFDHIVDDGKNDPYKHYELETNTTTLDTGGKLGHHKDAYKYHFQYDSKTKTLDLFGSPKE